MKKKYYNLGILVYNRHLKFGDPIIGGAIIGGSSLLSGIFGSEAQSDANAANIAIAQAQMEQQEKLFHEGNKFNHDEAALARQFSANQADIAQAFNAHQAQLNRDFQAGQLQKQMDWYENYNSASSQVQRYLDAGLNPASLAGKTDYSGSFGVPSGSAATATPASGIAASASAAPTVAGAHVEPVNPLGNVLTNALSGLQSYMTSRKTGEETKGISIENEFKRQEKDLGLKLTKSQIKENVAQVSYLTQEAELAKQKIAESSQIVTNLSKQGQKLDVEVELANMEKLYKSKAYDEMLGKLQQEHRLAKEEADVYVKMVMSEIAKNQSEAAAAYASAQYNKALSELVPEQRDRIIAEKSFIDSQTNGQRIQNYLNRKYGNKERALNLKQQKESIDKLEWENSGFVRGVGIVKDVAVTAASIVGTVYGAGAIGKGLSSTRTTYTTTITQ